MDICEGNRLTAVEDVPPIACLEKCGTILRQVFFAPNIVVERGGIVWKDAATGLWNPIPALPPAVFPEGFQIGIVGSRGGVDTTKCTPPVKARGEVYAFNARYAPARLKWPATITVANKGRYLALLEQVFLLPNQEQ
jgi:hypothetical protein